MSARLPPVPAHEAALRIRHEVATTLDLCARNLEGTGDDREADELQLVAARIRLKCAERPGAARWGAPWISKRQAAEILRVLGLDGEPSPGALLKRIDRAAPDDALHVLRKGGPARSPAGRLSEAAVRHVAGLWSGAAEIERDAVEEGKAMARAARDTAAAVADPARVAAQGRRHLDHTDRAPLSSLRRRVEGPNSDKR